MIHIQKPKSAWKVIHMDWFTALPPSGDKSYDNALCNVGRYRKTPIFLPCHKDDTEIDMALLLLWIRVTSHAAYHQQTDGLAERMIQTLENMIRRFSAYGLEFKDSRGFTHDWCTLIPKLELWDKIHKVPDVKLGDLFLVSILNFNNIKGPRKLKYLYGAPFFIVSLHETNAVQVELSVELENKHPTFPVSLIKPSQPAYREFFPLRNPAPLTVPPVEQSEDKKMNKVIKESRHGGKNQREYLFRYRKPVN
ncbi:hypothetical protein O181_003345 [Austropuccinia psidii MF-1]|uniref:Uncharacterized protein n=1 Tax=Austropuccinia psidii MF-1 TaxID=1389203 RepID=A0A9Q3GDT9_9BASI|nr:hypothetical protein [Austropuccinia psidii MF-1]